MINVLKQQWRKENNKGTFRMQFSKIVIVLFLLGLFANAQTEKNVDHQSLLWTRYNNQLELNEKWSIQTDLDNRIFTKPVEQNLFLARVQLRQKWNDKIEWGIGGVYSQVATQDPEVIKPFHGEEYRGQQDITLKQRLGKINLSHRYQVEERWIRNASQYRLEGGTSFYLRLRYKFQAEYAILKKEKQYLKGIVYDEILINGGNKIIKNTFDQNRIYAALQYGLSPAVALELGYLNSYQEKSNGVDYYNRDIIRFSFFHKLKI
ncbi:DUF2490 domain-containing protein [Flavobacterium ovatum]|uniref:DUF2490 domain-containing protein n=1 Tax=Flavobacterium ovatum TaxID=1928857 RepID=UPI00344BC27F